MKGVILAGGFATRLRPLSCSKPKLLFPLLGTPLIDLMYEWLARGGVGQVVLAVNHMSDKLRTEVAARKMEDKVILSVETTPLGTGGPLRLALPILGDEEAVVVVNGDVVSDIDLAGLARAHVDSDADATIALYSVKDTRPFGLVTLESQDQIVGFEEKSVKSEGPGWINAGVYILNRSVIEMIPEGRAVSLEREIFPVLAGRMKLRGWKHNGFWYDIGKIPDYVTANLELLERPDAFLKRKSNVPPVAVAGPSYIGSDCVIEESARVGPRVIMSSGVKVKAGANVRETIVFEDTVLGENCRVEESVIGERTVIGKSVSIGKGSVIAGQITVPEGTVVNPGSIVLN